jgi:hypothetical protein
MIKKLETVLSGAIYVAGGGLINYSVAEMTAKQLKLSYDAYLSNMRKYLKIKNDSNADNGRANQIF